MINLSLLNNFYPVISYRRVQKEKNATNYCIRFGHSLWSANQLPAQGINKQQHGCRPYFYPRTTTENGGGLYRKGMPMNRRCLERDALRQLPQLTRSISQREGNWKLKCLNFCKISFAFRGKGTEEIVAR